MPFLASFHHIVSVIPRFDKDLTAESGADSVQEVTEGFAVAGDISAAVAAVVAVAGSHVENTYWGASGIDSGDCVYTKN